jgi:hypothetical protein
MFVKIPPYTLDCKNLQTGEYSYTILVFPNVHGGDYDVRSAKFQKAVVFILSYSFSPFLEVSDFVLNINIVSFTYIYICLSSLS